jgi:hypothetical protein
MSGRFGMRCGRGGGFHLGLHRCRIGGGVWRLSEMKTFICSSEWVCPLFSEKRVLAGAPFYE